MTLDDDDFDFRSVRQLHRSAMFYYLLIAISLAIESAVCADVILENWANRTDYPAICDRAYRLKYFKTKEHRDAVYAGILYVPPHLQGPEGYKEVYHKGSQQRRFINTEVQLWNPSSGSRTVHKYLEADVDHEDEQNWDPRTRNSKFPRGSKQRKLNKLTRRNLNERRQASEKDDIDNERIKKCRASRQKFKPLGSERALPYMVFVDSGCNGAIIGKKWVLTAGHCIDIRAPEYVHVGSIDFLAGCQYNVVYMYVHPRYTRQRMEFDVALLKISPSFIFSPAIRPIPLSSSAAVKKSCGVLAAWSEEEYKGDLRVILSKRNIPVISSQKCKKFGIRKDQFCAGDKKPQIACPGDSGGPFVVNGALVGIMSIGYKCSRPHNPGVFVEMIHVRDWIRSVAGI